MRLVPHVLKQTLRYFRPDLKTRGDVSEINRGVSQVFKGVDDAELYQACEADALNNRVDGDVLHALICEVIETARRDEAKYFAVTNSPKVTIQRDHNVDMYDDQLLADFAVDEQ